MCVTECECLLALAGRPSGQEQMLPSSHSNSPNRVGCLSLSKAFFACLFFFSVSLSLDHSTSDTMTYIYTYICIVHKHCSYWYKSTPVILLSIIWSFYSISYHIIFSFLSVIICIFLTSSQQRVEHWPMTLVLPGRVKLWSFQSFFEPCIFLSYLIGSTHTAIGDFQFSFQWLLRHSEPNQIYKLYLSNYYTKQCFKTLFLLHSILFRFRVILSINVRPHWRKPGKRATQRTETML